MTSTERTYMLELTGKEVEMLSIGLSIALAAMMNDAVAGGLGLTMVEMRGKEGREVFVNANLKLIDVADGVPDNEWTETCPFPAATSGEVC
jgi:hypothetical protein